MSNKLGWTSKKQAKKLVDAGLDVNTADMAYRRFRVGSDFEWSPECVPYKNYLKQDDDGCSFPVNLVKPCWSLGALINLMPNFTMDSTGWCLFSIDSDPYSDYYHEIKCDENGEDDGTSSIMDNVVEMVLFMKRNGIHMNAIDEKIL